MNGWFNVAIAFPEDITGLEEYKGNPPPRYADAVGLPCYQCGVRLHVGPLLAQAIQTGAAYGPLCPWCFGVENISSATIQHLNGQELP